MEWTSIAISWSSRSGVTIPHGDFVGGLTFIVGSGEHAMGLGWDYAFLVSDAWDLAVVPVGHPLALSLVLAFLSSYHLASFFSLPTRVIIHLLHPC